MKIGEIELLNIDCMEYMATVPDKFFELGIIDPEYGIGESTRHSYHPNASTKYKPKKWDLNGIPSKQYFDELFRVTKQQIIWGANYFNLPICKKPIVWDKQQPEGIDQAMFEYAWQSQEDQQARIFRRSPSQDKNCVSNGDSRLRQTRMRIHPTQKPVALYKWLLKNYAKEGDKIFDSHGGSMSSVIACIDMGYSITCCELDKDYYNSAKLRIENHISQLDLFRKNEINIHTNTIQEKGWSLYDNMP